MTILEKIKLSWSEPKYDLYFPEDEQPRNCYKVKIQYNGKSTTLPFGDSIYNTENGTRTTDNDFLEGMVQDWSYNEENYPNFEWFCEEFGYDVDSRTAEKSYKNCMKYGAKLNRLFSAEDIEALRTELERESEN